MCNILKQLRKHYDTFISYEIEFMDFHIIYHRPHLPFWVVLRRWLPNYFYILVVVSQSDNLPPSPVILCICFPPPLEVQHN